MEEKKDYSKTLNLPKTEFEMRGNLTKKEPAILDNFINKKIYYLALEKNKNTGKRFVLHDGPPYANGDIHAGHALDKILKDIIIRYKTMNGYYAPYVPGWDTHGLPIEKKVQQDKKITKDDVGITKFREICKEYALDAVERTAKQFERLGGLGDYRDKSKRYLTLNKDFEAKQIGVFGDMYKKGYIYRDLKPVYWCSDCETALAEAEIEYKDDTSTSIYVKFKVQDDKDLFKSYVSLDNTYVVIWTTTPWTLPGNQAITLNPEFEYVLVEGKKEGRTENYVLAKELLEEVMQIGNIEEYKVLATFKGKELENIICINPVIENKTSRVILGSDKDLLVTLDAGTGCVHTAPGHGHEDYLCCKRYKDIEIIVPVDKHGHMTKEAGKFEGMFYAKANKEIIKYLEETNDLFAAKELTHQYPHCWRCKSPLIYYAKPAWYIKVSEYRDKMVEANKQVNWYPDYVGEKRFGNWLLNAQDWGISRSRYWGCPIPLWTCECGHMEMIGSIDELVNKSIEKIDHDIDLHKPYVDNVHIKCEKCGKAMNRIPDVIDVWFDSGAVPFAQYHYPFENKEYFETHFPADFIAEGLDQTRGWFYSLMAISVFLTGKAPYKNVLVNDLLLDKNGQKMHKSKGNAVEPFTIIEK